MNLAQMRTAVRDKLTAGLGMNSNISEDLFFANSEVNFWLNAAQREVYKQIRKARSNYFERVLKTTDSSLLILGRTFVPSSLKLVSGTGNYTLPPDFVAMTLMTDLDSGTTSTGVRFTGVNSIVAERFRVLMYTNGGSMEREYLYSVIGQRTLLIRPIPQESRNIEFVYEKMLPTLRDWNTGTATTTITDNTVTFSATADCLNRMQAGDQFIMSSSATVPTADPSVDYPTIASITNSTEIELDAPYLDASASSKAYIVSSVSEIPAHHHDILVTYACRQATMKGPNPAVDEANMFGEEYNMQLRALLDEVEGRQFSDIETSEPYLGDLYE